jgi:hypothetical protein
MQKRIREVRSQESGVSSLGRQLGTGSAFVLVGALLAFPALAREEVRRDFTKTVPLGAGKPLRVENTNGAVRIRAQAKPEVGVVATMHCSASTAAEAKSWCDRIQIHVDESASGISVRTEVPSERNLRNMGWSVDLDLTMPDSAPLDLRNRFGGVTVQGAHGGISVNNSNGNILVTSARGRLQVDNQFGNIEVQGCEGDLVVTNTNGTVRTSDIAGTAEIANRFGDIRVTNAAKTLTIHGGNARVDADHIGGMAIINSSFADVRVWDIRGDLSVDNQNGRVDAKTVSGAAKLQTSFAPVKFSGIGKGVTVRGQNSEVTGDTVGESAVVETSFAGVDLRGIKGSAHVTGGNSAVRLIDIGGEAWVKTTFAGVTVDNPGGPVTVENGNGSIGVSVKPGEQCHPLALHTSFAGIQVALPAGAGYNLTAKTSFGRIHSEHPVTVTGQIGNDELNGKIGSGGCDLRLTGQNGNIDILKR